MPGGGGSSSPSGNTVSTQQSNPWAGQAPFLSSTLAAGTKIPGTNIVTGDVPSNVTNNLGQFEAASALYNGFTPQYYPGTTYSPETAAQSGAIAGQENLGLNGSPITGASTSAALGILNPNFLTSNPSNQYLTPFASGGMAGAATGSVAPANAALDRYASGSMLDNAAPQTEAAIRSAVAGATPGLLDAFTQGNRLNSPGAAYGVASGVTSAAAPYVLQAQQDAQAKQLSAAQNEGLLGLNAQTLAQQGQLTGAQQIGQNYSTAAGQQNTANYTAPGVQGLGYTDLSNAYAAGTAQQNLGQSSIDDAVARFNYGQTLPYNLLNNYASLINGNYGGSSSISTPFFQQQSGGFGGALSGGLSGAASGALIGSVVPGIGTGVGALVGGLGGGLLGGFR